MTDKTDIVVVEPTHALARAEDDATRVLARTDDAAKTRAQLVDVTDLPIDHPTRLDQFDQVLGHTLSPNTRRAYLSAWRRFRAWCERHGICPLPVLQGDLLKYLHELVGQGKAWTTVGRVTLMAICSMHDLAGVPAPRPNANPQFKMALRSMQVVVGTAPRKQAKPLLSGALRAIHARIQPDNAQHVRDWAVLSFGFAGSFRRSELVALRIRNLVPLPLGYNVRIERSKTDQTGEGQLIAIPPGRNLETCPLRALQAWLALRGPLQPDDFVFTRFTPSGQLTKKGMNGAAVNAIVKQWAVGLPDAQGYSGHSLRAGLATQAALSHKSLASIKAQTRHKSLNGLDPYIRPIVLFDDNAFDDIGL